MKTIDIKIIDDRKDDLIWTNCFDVELTSKVDGIEVTIPAFINTENVVTTPSGVWLHSLFGNTPFRSYFVELVDSKVQEAFKNWNKDIKSLQIDI